MTRAAWRRRAPRRNVSGPSVIRVELRDGMNNPRNITADLVDWSETGLSVTLAGEGESRAATAQAEQQTPQVANPPTPPGHIYRMLFTSLARTDVRIRAGGGSAGEPCGPRRGEWGRGMRG